MIYNFLELVNESSSYNMVKFHNMVKLQSMNILELGSSVPHSYIPELETLIYTLLVGARSKIFFGGAYSYGLKILVSEDFFCYSL